MTLEESKEVIPMMEAMITQIEGQQNIMAEMLQAAAENLRRQVKNYLDEATQAKNEASELKRQLFKAQQGRGQ